MNHSFSSTSLSTLEQIVNKTSEGSISNDQSSPSSLKLFESQQKISSTSVVTQSAVVPIQQLSSVNRSQLMPDFIINDKQITNRIFNENRIPSTAEFILDQIISDHINQSVRDFILWVKKRTEENSTCNHRKRQRSFVRMIETHHHHHHHQSRWILLILVDLFISIRSLRRLVIFSSIIIVYKLMLFPLQNRFFLRQVSSYWFVH